ILSTQGASSVQSSAAIGLQSLLDGDQWLIARNSLVNNQRIAWTISVTLTKICVGIAAVEPPAGAICQLAALGAGVMSTIENFQLGQYGLVVGLQIAAPRDGHPVGEKEVRVETYRTKPMALTATIRTQKQLNAEDWIITAIQLPLTIIGLHDLDPRLLT